MSGLYAANEAQEPDLATVRFWPNSPCDVSFLRLFLGADQTMRWAGPTAAFDPKPTFGGE